MRGVGIDVANPRGKISLNQYRRLGIDFVRAEIRAEQGYLPIPTALLYGPSTESFYIPTGPDVVCVIIGNEPDGDGDSSWKMTTDEYINFYNTACAEISSNVKVCAAGMVKGIDFLVECWPSLERKPDIVNKHYPDTPDEIIAFRQQFKCPIMIGEWCYKTATQQEMIDWVQVLDQYAEYHSWFALDEAMAKNMGLYNNGRITTAGRRFRSVLL